jgi:cytosine/uracil/thiamine/allantoin permease
MLAAKARLETREPLRNRDLAPPWERRARSTRDGTAPWIGTSVVVTTCLLASGRMQRGMVFTSALHPLAYLLLTRSALGAVPCTPTRETPS